MLFLNILKLVWLRWSIVTFFQWQFFGTGRLHLYLLLPFATNDNLDIEANLQYDFWLAGWLANNQQTICRYKLSPKQFTHGYTRITGAVGHFSLRQPQGNMGWGTNHFDWVRVILHSFPSITIGWWGSTFVAQSYIGMKKIVKNCRSVEFEKLPAVISNLRVGGGLFAHNLQTSPDMLSWT